MVPNSELQRQLAQNSWNTLLFQISYLMKFGGRVPLSCSIVAQFHNCKRIVKWTITNPCVWKSFLFNWKLKLVVPTTHVYLIYNLLVYYSKQDQRLNSYSCGIKVQESLVPAHLALAHGGGRWLCQFGCGTGMPLENSRCRVLNCRCQRGPHVV